MPSYKLVVLGEGGVGKSAITIQFTSNVFSPDYDPTIEDAYRIEANIDGEVVGLDILDTAGQEVFSAVRDRYMRDGEGFLLVYSLTQRSTFVPLSKVYEQIKRVKDTSRVPVVLVGNKCDIADTQREVQHGEGEFLARSFNCPFFETSAKLRINIDNAFHELVRQIKKWQPDQDKPGVDNQNSKSGCCVLL
ncbi:ras-like protein rasG [Dysidea avara]|uniref:ras-like protein rasG n=1 Tax=Dysidea avara TaxID=196820 RepID=UPI0033318388